MAQTVSITITSEDRARLAAVIEERNSAQKHVQRARILMRPDCRASFSIYDVFQRTAHLADAWRRRERICRSAPFTIQITPPTYERTILPATYDGIVFIAQSTAAKPLE